MTRPRYRLFIFESVGGWYWRLRSRHNSKIVCTGHEPFATRANALRSFRRLGLPDSTWEMG